MIPYWQLSFLPAGAGFVSVHLLTTLAGLSLAYLLFVRRAVRAGLSRARAEEFSFFAIVPGLLGAHLGYLFLAGWPGGWFRNLNPLAGAVTFPGLLCSFLAIVWRLRRWRASGEEWQLWFDTGAKVFPWAWIVIRTGCFLAHDEPGIHTSFPLAVLYPDGPRHDLALYELLWASAMAAVRPGIRQLLLTYALLRLTLHWLRPERHLTDLAAALLLLLVSLGWPAVRKALQHRR